MTVFRPINAFLHGRVADRTRVPADKRRKVASQDYKVRPLTELGVKMVVFDMAGTVVDEGGIVYTTLKKVMRDEGIAVDDKEFDLWHGANKREVVAHFVNKERPHGGEMLIDKLYAGFESALETAYFAEDSPLKPIPGAIDLFKRLRAAGIKSCLDTGFPRKIADRIISKLGYADHTDDSCVSMEVGNGRPFPYMIHELMRRHRIEQVSQIVKVGDTARDMEEGCYAGTPHVFGVLTGADNRVSLEKAGAAAVFESVADIPVVSQMPMQATQSPRKVESYEVRPLTELGVKMVVFDMAGTVVDEGGIVYSTLKKVMRDGGLTVDDTEFDAWHGANKREVIAHFVSKSRPDGGETLIDKLYGSFESELEATYFVEDSPLKPIPGAMELFKRLRAAGIKSCLDTGFPRKIADHIIAKLGYAEYTDGSCVSMEVGHGRPYPYMIFDLMRRHKIERASQIVKVGDTARDMEEGRYAGTPHVYGVLTGADNRKTLSDSGAAAVFDSVADIPVSSMPKRVLRSMQAPQAKRRRHFLKSPSLEWKSRAHVESYAVLPLTEMDVKMVVFDMAGTVVDEGGIVYSTLKKVMRDGGLVVDDTEFDAWHGANKREVIAHFVSKEKPDGGETLIDNLYGLFEAELEATYFAEDSPLKPIPGAIELFQRLRAVGIKSCLDTGFPRKIADHIIAKLGYAKYTDGCCVSMEVGNGRPFPYMIFELMRRHKIEKVSQIVKVGDTARDMEEGRHSGTPHVYGVLTGADNRETLLKHGAAAVFNSIADFVV